MKTSIRKVDHLQVANAQLSRSTLNFFVVFSTFHLPLFAFVFTHCLHTRLSLCKLRLLLCYSFLGALFDFCDVCFVNSFEFRCCFCFCSIINVVSTLVPHVQFNKNLVRVAWVNRHCPHVFALILLVFPFVFFSTNFLQTSQFLWLLSLLI